MLVSLSLNAMFTYRGAVVSKFASPALANVIAMDARQAYSGNCS
jgi:hypothetical protein